MKVIYTDGTEGTASIKDSRNLNIEGRFTKESWEELEKEMIRLNIIAFEDSIFTLLGKIARFQPTLINIEYVRNQIAAH